MRRQNVRSIAFLPLYRLGLRQLFHLRVILDGTLIVDDEPHIRELLAFAFTKAGLETREAADGEAALTAIAAAEPDLVVLRRAPSKPS